MLPWQPEIQSNQPKSLQHPDDAKIALHEIWSKLDILHWKCGWTPAHHSLIAIQIPRLSLWLRWAYNMHSYLVGIQA